VTIPAEDDHDTMHHSPRRRRSLRRKRLMDVDQGGNVEQLPPGTPVAIYSRVSSDEQVHGYSLAAQVQECEVFAKQRSWSIVRYYSDPGQSARDDRRPAFSRMIEEAHQGVFKAILFHKLDRFSRNIENTLRHFRDLNACDVLIASVTEDFDFTTAQGRLVFRMMALFAQWYLENLSAEVVKSKLEMARRGIQNGAVPFGYVKDQQSNQVFVVEQEAELIRTAFELYATGTHTDQTIADFLNASASRTRRGNRWSKDTVTDSLQNEFYHGMVAYRDQVWPGRHPAIVSRELFDRVREIRARHAHRPRSAIGLDKVVHANLLRRIVCCHQCGRTLRIQSTRKYGYYLEPSRLRAGECVHSGSRVRMEFLDVQVVDLLKQVKLPEEWQQAIRHSLQSHDVIRTMEKRLQEIERELQRAGRAFADGHMSEKDYERRRRKLLPERDQLLQSRMETTFDTNIPLESMQQFMEAATREERKRILHLLLESVRYDFGRKRVVAFKPHEAHAHLFYAAAGSSGWNQKEDGFLYAESPGMNG